MGQICQHAADDYPDECCGILVGTRQIEKRVLACHRTANLNRERAHDRYQISPEEHYQIDKQARDNHLGLIGFYHSHPDSPPCPSAYDEMTAWPIYSYLIISVDKDKNTLVKSWVLDDKGKQMVAEEICQL
jgi:proteasome lid subunit RPN8/RPN11